jgi:hypothetical protein
VGVIDYGNLNGSVWVSRNTTGFPWCRGDDADVVTRRVPQDRYDPLAGSTIPFPDVAGPPVEAADVARWTACWSEPTSTFVPPSRVTGSSVSERKVRQELQSPICFALVRVASRSTSG